MEVTTGAEHHQVRVSEASQPSEARMVARDLAQAAGFDETDMYRVGIVATELATNLVKYATLGEILVRRMDGDGPGGVELLAIDRGPGLPDVDIALRDGHSTGGSQGTGLGAVRRLSEEFDIHSSQRGTVVLARIYAGRSPAPAAPFQFGAVSVALSRDEPCGDSWAVRAGGNRIDALVIDGLGHGLLASEAARAGVAAWAPARYPAVAEALSGIHESMRHTRGAAGAIAEVDRDARVMRFAGIGNVAASVLMANGKSRQAVSHNGTLGHEARAFREFLYPWEADSLLVVHSDGMTTHWSLDAYRGITRRHPALVAAVLYRDFSRGRDDVTVLVCREAA
jgi:anti-sigma regulatory factor (Ser/Thr protein kinase)